MNVFNWPKTTCGTFCCCSCSFLPPPLSLLSSPTPTRPGAVKTGGRGFVLDHRRWPAPMRRVIDDLLTKYQGQEDMLRLVDHDGSGRDKRRSRQKPVILVGSANRGTTTMVPRYTSPISGNWMLPKEKVEEKGHQKRKRTEPEPPPASPSTGGRCGFCRKELKQTSHTHWLL
ncbi:uncharacterized protein LOC121202620 isoform X3 [Betta splendens]|uniref:Uncharacterized protein LOC121202620 isoform X3 n=1 Tax=Betta splendens TaxID=158456 RepID=A0A9W2Y4G7_BETSP|nr:uncharacterized protein LOC121202620 isoform X3 [Betta splendens]